jgi:hypothetical protein
VSEGPAVSFATFSEAAAQGRWADCEAFMAQVDAQWGLHSLESLVVHSQFSHRLSDFPAALALCEEITQRFPHYPNHRYVLADVCAHLGEEAPARAALAAFAAGDDPLIALQQSVEVLHLLGLDDEVIALAREAPLTRLEGRLARMFLAQSLMRRDGIAAGLADYAEAWTTPQAKAAIHDAPDLMSDPLQWRADHALPEEIRVFRRGGVGDTLQWMRYLPYLRAAGVRAVIAENDDPAPGLKTVDLGDETAADGARRRLAAGARPPALEPIQIAEPFMLFTGLFPSLGHAARTEGYLRPSPDIEVDELLSDIAAHAAGRPRMAIFWSANESHHIFAHKSLTLAQIAPVLAREDIHWVVLQRGAERAAWLKAPRAALTSNPPASFSFNQTAGLLAGLDAVVTIDSAMAHLAGGLGRPTFLLASAAADWRWGREDRVTPWYPTMDIVRQPSLGDWPGAVRALGGRLDLWMSGFGPV